MSLKHQQRSLRRRLVIAVKPDEDTDLSKLLNWEQYQKHLEFLESEEEYEDYDGDDLEDDFLSDDGRVGLSRSHNAFRPDCCRAVRTHSSGPGILRFRTLRYEDTGRSTLLPIPGG